MASLHHILSGVRNFQTTGNPAVVIESICLDSREVKPGSLFMALRGTASDGHAYLAQAATAGAAAILCETLPHELANGVVYVQVPDSTAVAGMAAANFYGNPSDALVVTGVTGTNGKTTVATLLYRLFTAMGYTCGLLSTVQNHVGAEVIPATHTTPNPVALQQLLHQMREAGCKYVFMEVSSHAIAQHRIAGIRFAGGVFTNISLDHLDYHKTFDEYISVKKSFFDKLPGDAFALSNADDKRGNVMLQNTLAEKQTYSLRSPASFTARVMENNLSGLVMQIDGLEVHCRLTGIFNAYNLLAIYATATLLHQEKTEVLAALSALEGAPGRFETYLSPKEKILGIIDYAHTPDALLNVLATINQMRTAGQQVITVVGCGGDRDKTKRPLMAAAAAAQSDKAILTSDNPRTENPEAILDDMEAELTGPQRRKVLRIANRREAIKTACMMAQAGDVILVAGKGHETYQEINGVKTHFDDSQVLTETFDLLQK